MGLASNFALISGATLAATGGTSYPFAPSGKTVLNGIHLIDTASSDIRLQPSIFFNQRFPARQSDGTYSLYKQSVNLGIPKLCADGIVRMQRLRIERETLAEATPAEKLALLNLGAQFCFDADTTAFWASGSVA
jgi:hypothetical protein